MASAAAAAARPGVAYTLGRTLYLSVTNRSNALSILKTRGPGFVMPPSSGFALLSDPEPDASELAAIVDATYERAEIVGMGENDPGVVFAGAGEPLLRLDVVVDTIAMVRESRHGVPFRVHSNGLHEPDVAKTLANAKVDRVTVALATADPKQFDFFNTTERGLPRKRRRFQPTLRLHRHARGGRRGRRGGDGRRARSRRRGGAETRRVARRARAPNQGVLPVKIFARAM
jgi:hypothetical protein